MEGEYQPNYLSVELRPELEASAYARKVLCGAFRELPERAMAELLTVVGELVTNAVLHGPGSSIGLRVSLDPTRQIIHGEVVDQGDPAKSIPRIREVATTKPRRGGYGLRLVEAMTSKWWVVEGSTSVQFEIPLERK